MNKGTGRIIILLAGAGLILHTISAMLGRHYYRITYGLCLSEGPFSGSLCRSWTLEAVFEILAIAALGIGAWIFNERRTELQR